MALTGLLGGSFNPAHDGHRSISLFAVDKLKLEEMWWLVSPKNPLKTSKDMASLHTRLASAHIKTKNSKIKATAIERELGTRFTLDTLRKLKRRYPKRRFIWIMGADNLAQFHLWRGWKEIAKTMPIIVIERPEYNESARFSAAMIYLRKYRCNIDKIRNLRHCKVPALIFLRFRRDLRSATKIRIANPNWDSAYKDYAVKDGITHKIYV